jgi:multidrug resistance efflux pump
MKLLDAQIQGSRDDIERHTKFIEALTSKTQQIVQDLRLDLKKTSGVLAGYLAQKEELTYCAKSDGYIVKREAEEGKRVLVGEAILTVVTGKSLWANAYIPQEQPNLVNDGDRLTLLAQNRSFSVRVEAVSQVVTPIPGAPASVLGPPEKFIEVRLKFLDVDRAREAGLRHGMTATTEIPRLEGLLYRLGLKKARTDKPPPSARNGSA